jgi:hypothetical protein
LTSSRFSSLHPDFDAGAKINDVALALLIDLVTVVFPVPVPSPCS